MIIQSFCPLLINQQNQSQIVTITIIFPKETRSGGTFTIETEKGITQGYVSDDILTFNYDMINSNYFITVNSPETNTIALVDHALVDHALVGLQTGVHTYIYDLYVENYKIYYISWIDGDYIDTNN